MEMVVQLLQRHLGNHEEFLSTGKANLYISDEFNVRKINAATGIITSVAGKGTAGGDLGDGGPATAAYVRAFPVFADDLGNFIFSQRPDILVRKVDVTTGIITSMSGIPLHNPGCLFQDKGGNIFIYDDSLIRVDATTGNSTRFAGNGIVGYSGDGGMASNASISTSCSGMAIDSKGNFYFMDGGNHVVRKIDVHGKISTCVGTGLNGFSGDGGPATNAKITGYGGLAIDIYDNLIIGDNNRIRIVNTATGIITTAAGGGTQTNSGADALVADIGTIHDQSNICLDGNGNLFFIGTDRYLKKITNFNPGTGGAVFTSDSFSVTVIRHCNGPDFGVTVPHYSPAKSVKTFFGDGTTDSSTILSGLLGCGDANISHAYQASGTYAVKQVLYQSGMAIDSISYSTTYEFCRTLPVKFYHDLNNNCVMDSGEMYSKVSTLTEVSRNGVPIDTISATAGFNYDAYCTLGDHYSFKFIDDSGHIHATCPPSGVLRDTISSTTTDYVTKYFGLKCVSSAGFDLAGHLITVGTGVHAQAGHVYVLNNLCQGEDATITLSFSPKYVYAWAFPPPYSVLGNNITWNLSNVSATDGPDHFFQFRLSISGGTLSIHDTVTERLTVTPAVGDVNTANNYFIKIDTVKGSYDPNEISAVPGGCIPDGVKLLQYTINFENTGNDTAHNIYVLDTLSPNLDPRSIRILLASSTMNISSYKASNFNVVKFDFPNINLLDSSHHGQCDGNVIFTINTANGLSAGTAIYNRAGIYFDDNPVVMTNMVTNIVNCPPPTYVPIVPYAFKVDIFPNPAGNEFVISTSANDYNEYIVSNCMGQAMARSSITSLQTKVDVTRLPPGLYFVTLVGEKGTITRKVIKL